MADVITPSYLLMLSAAVLLVAVLYSSVGHGGASGYIAVMALCNVAPESLKFTALSLNILVSAIATIVFARAGHFNWRLFWPFALASAPCSFIGGYLTLPSHLYRPLVGVLLLLAAYRLFSRNDNVHDSHPAHRQSLPVSLAVGGFLGLLSGLTGVGGGIFLSPLLLLLGWARTREVSAVSALFILVNSLSGLAGHISKINDIPGFVPLIAVTAIVGGIIGSNLGSKHLPTAIVVRAMSVVLTIAAMKLIFVR